MNNKITTNTITKEKIIKDLAKNGNLYDIDTIRMIYKELENNIKNYLTMATPEQNVKIKLFEGMVVQGEYIQEQTKVNNGICFISGLVKTVCQVGETKRDEGSQRLIVPVVSVNQT